jgi:TM2 domain-containing membrane protein YozV
MDVISGEKFCRDCGASIKLRAEICPKCGCRQITESKKSQTVAGLLAIFVGGLGIHKFYIGKTFSGFLYLLFCWTFIPTFLGLIDGIILLAMDEKNFQDKEFSALDYGFGVVIFFVVVALLGIVYYLA